MLLSIAIFCGLMALLSTTVVLATCLTASTARKRVMNKPMPPLTDIHIHKGAQPVMDAVA